jgi:hypothetical protein
MEPIQCSETLAYKIQTPWNYPEDNILHPKHGESLKITIEVCCQCLQHCLDLNSRQISTSLANYRNQQQEVYYTPMQFTEMILLNTVVYVRCNQFKNSLALLENEEHYH